MRIFLTVVFAVAFASGLSVSSCAAQAVSGKTSESAMRERIATIFSETIKSGETRVEQNGQFFMAVTFIPPTTEHVDEIRRCGQDAIPILSDYLSKGSGFERYHAMRFLGAIGGKEIIEPLRRVALEDPSPSFRSSALRWLSTTPWDLAAPIIRQAAENDVSEEVRTEAKEILARH